MLNGNFRRIYHYHLMKCGGTTINHWLDTLTFDEHTPPGRWTNYSLMQAGFDDMGEPVEIVVPQLAKTLFYWSDVIHSHTPLRMYAPENTLCLTVLRDPIQRLVSLIAVWRTLDVSGKFPATHRERIKDSQCLSLCDFLEKHGKSGGRALLDNYLTRALAAGRIGTLLANTTHPDRLCEVALQSLEQDYDLIGLTENLDLCRNALSAMVGLAPAREIPALNVTRVPGHPDLEQDRQSDILHSLTRVDRVMYDRARQLFEQRHRAVAEAYDVTAFETNHAGRLLAEARGSDYNGATRYSVRSPITGSGFHGRDSSFTPSCAVWTGPATRTTLYIPTPPNMRLSLLIWIRGYADIRQRGQIRVRVDGRSASHYFESADNYADLLVIDTSTIRDFGRLEIDIDETLDSGDPGSERHDARKRGFSFDTYGWRPA